MLDVGLDGLSIILAYKEVIAIFFISALGLGLFIVNQITLNDADNKMKLPLCFSVGFIALCATTYILIWLTQIWPALLRLGSFIIFFFAVLVLLQDIYSKGIKADGNFSNIIVSIVMVSVLLLIRLTFLKYSILPSYSDSPIHYQIISQFIDPNTTIHSKLSLGNIFSNYYHFGFHSLSAWLTTLTGLDLANTISLLGQISLVIAPISVALLSYTLTKSNYCALFTGLLAAIGWSMPAFSVNWGKFPALISLASAPAFIAFAKISTEKANKKVSTIFWGLLLLFGTAIMHTRIIICILLALISFFISSRLQVTEKPGFLRALTRSSLFVFSLLSLSKYLIVYYNRFPLWVILLLLLPFAFQAYPKISAGIFLYTFGVWLSTLTLGISASYQGLLDDQFINIMLYIPLSIIGGMGFAGVMENKERGFKWVIIVVLFGLVTFNFQQGASIYPDTCCDYFQEDDQLAFQWIRKNTSENTLFIIPTFYSGGRSYGTDAGIWIYPLTERSTNKLPFNINWNSPEAIGEICKSNSTNIYIYSGGRAESFSSVQLSKIEWVRLVNKVGQVEIFKVLDCSLQ